MTPNERYLAITTWRRIKEAQKVKERRLDRYEREMTQTREFTDEDFASMIKRNEVPHKVGEILDKTFILPSDYVPAKSLPDLIGKTIYVRVKGTVR